MANVDQLKNYLWKKKLEVKKEFGVLKKKEMEWI